MKQRTIDLVPDSIRIRSQAGVVAGRYVAALLIAIALMVVTVTHSRLVLDRAHKRLRVVEEQADLVLSAEAKADQLRSRLDDTRDQIRRYRLIAMPLEVSRVIATVTNELPTSATLDRIDLFSGSRRTNRSARSRGIRAEDGPAPRILSGELSGFAATDQEVAEIVARLEALGLFKQVGLNFSRTRPVRGRGAREFRISFRIDMDVEYDVVDRVRPELQASQEGAHDVQ